MINGNSKTYQADVIIAGAGIAGLVTAYDCLQSGKTVIILDKSNKDNLGGSALEAAGGIHLIDSPIQRRLGIKDSPELGLRDWLSVANFSEKDYWPKEWAKLYCEKSIEIIFALTKEIKSPFIPSVQWIERGVFTSANSVPRWHLTWGTGYGLIQALVTAIDKLPQSKNLKIYFQHGVENIIPDGNSPSFEGTDHQSGKQFKATGDCLVIATGGTGGGDLSAIREYWSDEGPQLPELLLNGAHLNADGSLHKLMEKHGANLTNLHNNWLYPAGVHHPEKRKPFDGISVVPGPSCLWFNAIGERIGPVPLSATAGFRFVVNQILQQPGGYSWSILNWKIAIKEVIVSLSRYFDAIRNKKKLLLIKNILFGDKNRIEKLIKECPQDVLLANSLDDLLLQMQNSNLYGLQLNADKIKDTIKFYDDQIKRGKKYYNDDQIRRIMNYRLYLPDKLRLLKPMPIDYKKHYPLMAIRQFPITRKSLGGIQTDLNSRVLKKSGEPFKNIYAVGEAAGFGGGGINGQQSLEGTFLGGCILTARIAAKHITSN